MKRHISAHFAIDFPSNSPVWREMRNSAGMDEHWEKVGQETVARCNADLHAAQAKRNQPAEDGYDFSISHGTRARLHVFPTTARAMAHEAVNQTILKNLPVGAAAAKAGAPNHDVPRELQQRRNKTVQARDAVTGRFTRNDTK
ncbi:hypothetical protein [Mycobacterium sp. 23]|uniref:hypothetical protein n=1 Tax=Mycobacterium sp. 23 TaxID=3400424 RepID=UPI003AABCFDA